MPKEERTVRVHCSNCGGGYRNHRIICEKKHRFADDPYGGWDHDEIHQFIQCMGCESYKYRRFSISLYSQDPIDGHFEPYDEHIYPDSDRGLEKRGIFDFGEDDLPKELIPQNVWKMYEETVRSLNADAKTLAGGGLRATVEAICRDLGITKGNLENRIDELERRKLLTKSQAELLHEERYIGNAALHEMTTPSVQDIKDGLEIVEGLINTIFILPEKAQRLKKGREKAARKKQSKKKKPSKKSSSKSRKGNK